LPSRRLERAVYGLIDQGSASTLIFVITVLVARSGGSREVGLFAVFYGAFLVALGLHRATVSQPLLATPITSDRLAAQAGRTTTVAASILLAVPTAITAAVLGMSELLAIAIVGPGLLLLDLHRHIRHQGHDVRGAALISASWLVGLLVGSPWIQDAQSALWIWGGVGTLIALICELMSGSAPIAWLAAKRWQLTQAKLSTSLAADSVIATLGTNIAGLIVGARGGLTELGTLRTAIVLFGPVLLLQQAVSMQALPRLAVATPEHRLALGNRITVLTVLIASVGGVAILLLAPLFEAVLFAGAVGIPVIVLVGLAIQVLAIGLYTTPTLMRKVEGRYEEVVLVRGLSFGAGLAAVGFSPLGESAQGAAAAFALQGLLLAGGLRLYAWRRNRRPGPPMR